jgi:hypothetical protein
MSTTHFAPCLFPLLSITGVDIGANMTATGIRVGDRVAGGFNATNNESYDGNDFPIIADDLIVNETGVDLTGVTMNFNIAKPHPRHL